MVKSAFCAPFHIKRFSGRPVAHFPPHVFEYRKQKPASLPSEVHILKYILYARMNTYKENPSSASCRRESYDIAWSGHYQKNTLDIAQISNMLNVFRYKSNPDLCVMEIQNPKGLTYL